MAAADAGCIFTACCRDVTTIDVDDATRRSIISATDAGAKAVAAGVQRTLAINGQYRGGGHKDAGIVLVESLHGVCRSIGKYDGGIALAGDARPFVA